MIFQIKGSSNEWNSMQRKGVKKIHSLWPIKKKENYVIIFFSYLVFVPYRPLLFRSSTSPFMISVFFNNVALPIFCFSFSPSTFPDFDIIWCHIWWSMLCFRCSMLIKLVCWLVALVLMLSRVWLKFVLELRLIGSWTFPTF